MGDNGSPLPIFETDDERSYFTVILKIHDAFTEEIVSDFDKVKPSIARRSRKQIREEALKLLGDYNYSQNELAQQMGYSGVSKTLSEVVESMVHDGLIIYIGADSKRSPNLKLKLIDLSESHQEANEQKATQKLST